jgi:predicted transcriptional regulator
MGLEDKLDKMFKSSESDIKRRLNEIITDLGISQTDFIKRTGYAYPSAYRYIREDASIRLDFLLRIAESFPQYNMDWVITGRGNMKFKRQSEKTDGGLYFLSDVKESYGEEYIRMKEKIIGLQDELIECMKSRNKPN